jgi:hypothetical protein
MPEQTVSVFAVMPGREYKGGSLGISVKVLYVQNGRVYYRRLNPPSRFGTIFSKPIKEFQQWLTM